MGFSLRRLGKIGGSLLRSPLGKIARLVPGLGQAVSLGSMALSAYGAVSAGRALLGSGGGAPAFAGPMGSPPLQGTMSGPGTGMPFNPNMGKRSIFRNDPNVAETLKPYAIDDRFLKTYHRAPKGFVVLKDTQGDAFAIPKPIAIAHHLWRAGKKPPISVGDWSKLMGANRVVKKFRDMEKKAMKIANFHAPRRSKPLGVAQLPGRTVVIRK